MERGFGDIKGETRKLSKKQKTLEPLNFLQIHKIVHNEERKIHSRFPIPTTTQQDFDMRDELNKFYRKKQFYTKEQIEGLAKQLQKQIEYLEEEKESLKKLIKNSVNTQFWLMNEMWIRRCKAIDVQVKTLGEVLVLLTEQKEKKDVRLDQGCSDFRGSIDDSLKPHLITEKEKIEP